MALIEIDGLPMKNGGSFPYKWRFLSENSHGKWPIEIDDLPGFTVFKHGDFPWRTVSHNQMV